MDLPDCYKKHFLLIEAIIPVVILIGLFILFSRYLTQDQVNTLLSNTEEKIYPVISIGAITLLGFIITGVSILITFTETPSLKPLKTSKQYSTLFKIYFSAIKHLAILTFLSGIGMLITQSLISQIIFYLVILFVLISTFRIWRCLWVLEQFIEITQSYKSNEKQ
jgi:uncharacterized membrane protein